MSETGTALVSEHVGLVGFGQVGRPLAHRLVAGGAQVHGYDTTAEGVMPSDSVAGVAAICLSVVLMLLNSDVVDAVATEIAAVVRSGGQCRHFVDMSSSEPRRTRALAERLRQDGIALVDAPVSGGVGAARAGTLTVMVGDTAEQYEEVRLLASVGSSIVHVGPVGAGHALKALNNLMSACSMLITAEAIAAATRFGIEPATALAVVNSASGRSGPEAKFPKFVLPRTFDSGFTAARMDEDVGIAIRLGRDLAIDVTLAEAVAVRWHELASELGVGADHTEIV